MANSGKNVRGLTTKQEYLRRLENATKKLKRPGS